MMTLDKEDLLKEYKRVSRLSLLNTLTHTFVGHEGLLFLLPCANSSIPLYL
jgi:hypothetical protein